MWGGGTGIIWLQVWNHPESTIEWDGQRETVQLHLEQAIVSPDIVWKKMNEAPSGLGALL